MAAMTDYLENILLNAVLRNTAYISPTTVYLALFTTATTDAGGGTEVTGGSYARLAVTFIAPSNGVTENAAVINFNNMPAIGAPGITHCAIFDAVTGGNMLLHGALATARTVGAGDTLTFGVGALDITLA